MWNSCVICIKESYKTKISTSSLQVSMLLPCQNMYPFYFGMSIPAFVKFVRAYEFLNAMKVFLFEQAVQADFYD